MNDSIRVDGDGGYLFGSVGGQGAVPGRGGDGAKEGERERGGGLTMLRNVACISARRNRHRTNRIGRCS